MKFGLRELVLTSLILGIVAGACAMIVQPHASVRREQLTEIQSMEAELSAIGKSADCLDDLTARLDRQRKMEARLRNKLADTRDAQKILDEIRQAAAANSLQAARVQLMKPGQIGGLCVQPIALRLTGSFNGFYSFLLNLEQSQRAITEMHFYDDGSADGQIQAEITLSMLLPADDAIAAPSDRAQQSSSQLISSFLHRDRFSSDGLSKTFANTDDLLAKCTADAALSQVPPGEIRYDPFRFNAPMNARRDITAQQEQSDGDRIAVLQELGKLQLQSICGTDAHPACMINSRLYHEGEQIDRFTIERIGAPAVVIRNGGYRFELKVAS